MKPAEKLLDNDPASKMLGISLIDVADGQCQIEMSVREDMLNGYNVCHGGFVFTLADTALAFACAEKDVVTVSASCAIDYLLAAELGDKLKASCNVNRTSGRNIYCDVEVVNQNGGTVALVRGRQVKLRK
jgi:acyl-CoA thioesterase